jgi:hypothetical protein
VKPTEYEWARMLTESVAPGSFVVAPVDISIWLPTFHDRVQPMLVRPMYLDKLRSQIGIQVAIHRVLMTNYVSGEAKRPDAPKWFSDGLRVFDIEAVCFEVTQEAARTRAILQRSGYGPYQRSPEFEIWVRR